MVGNEGLIGMSAFGGDPESGETAVLEIAEGDAQVMDMKVFQREMERRAAFHDLIPVCRRADVSPACVMRRPFSEGLMRSVACNALHPVERRCARCLLDIRDRVGRNELPVTQDTLSEMLGVRRASITLAEGALRRTGLIDHAHKSIVVTDLTGLQAAACECYGVIKGHFARLLP